MRHFLSNYIDLLLLLFQTESTVPEWCALTAVNPAKYRIRRAAALLPWTLSAQLGLATNCDTHAEQHGSAYSRTTHGLITVT